MRKNTFSQKLGLNTFFGKKVKTEWVTGIEIDEQREAEIQFYFSNKVEFHLATPPDELVSLLENLNLELETLQIIKIILFLEKKFQWFDLLLWTTFLV